RSAGRLVRQPIQKPAFTVEYETKTMSAGTVSDLAQVLAGLRTRRRKWLVTGVAGVIGSNLPEALLKLDQQGGGLGNFSSGNPCNLDETRARVTSAQWDRFTLREGDIADMSACRQACAGVDLVLHEAALGSVPASMADPLGAHNSNVTGFLNVLLAACEAGSQ